MHPQSRQARTFWRWLRDLSQARMHKAWMAGHFHDRVCPVCATWYGDSLSWDARVSTGALTERITCTRCHSTTEWMHDAMLPRSTKVTLPREVFQLLEHPHD